MIAFCLVAICVGLALLVFGIWFSGLSEQRRVNALIRNTIPISRRNKDQTCDWEVTRPDGIRNRIKRFKTTLAGVGRFS